jgi:hypothetical protein
MQGNIVFDLSVLLNLNLQSKLNSFSFGMWTIYVFPRYTLPATAVIVFCWEILVK